MPSSESFGISSKTVGVRYFCNLIVDIDFAGSFHAPRLGDWHGNVDPGED